MLLRVVQDGDSNEPAEPLESDLAVQVEYDMDEQGAPPLCECMRAESPTCNSLSLVDQEWVDAINSERKERQLDKVSYETFEIIMDRLEKEWFDLVSVHVIRFVFRLIY